MDDNAASVSMGGGRTMRPATSADIKLLRSYIVEAIDTSPFYNAEFKAHEKARLNERFLRALIAADPWYVPLVMYQGEVAGFVIQTPEFGVLWATWIYVSPRFRQTSVALTAINFLIRHWDNGRFHKVSCLVAPANERSVAVMTHFGFVKTALLSAHLFGQDYLLLERPFNKAVPGYAPPINLSRKNWLKLRLKSAFHG